MFSSKSTQKLKRGRKISGQKVWIKRSGEFTYERPDDFKNWIKFDSSLEFRFWKSLTEEEQDFCIPQSRTPIVMGEFNLFWEPDFSFPNSGVIVEIKGGWIEEDINKGKKELLLLKLKLASNAGYKVHLVSDKKLKFPEFSVHNLNNWRETLCLM